MKIHIMYANFDNRNWWKNRTKFGPIPGNRQMNTATEQRPFFWGFGYVRGLGSVVDQP